jgi:ATP synthase protein I
MNSLEGKMKHYTIVVVTLLMLFLIGYISTTYKPQFFGLFIGLIFSFFSLWTTYRKAQFVGDMASGIKRYKLFSYFISSFGIAIRITLAILCVWIALRYPEQLHLFSVITGFALIYIIIMADMLIQTVRKR